MNNRPFSYWNSCGKFWKQVIGVTEPQTVGAVEIHAGLGDRDDPPQRGAGIESL